MLLGLFIYINSFLGYKPSQLGVTKDNLLLTAGIAVVLFSIVGLLAMADKREPLGLQSVLVLLTMFVVSCAEELWFRGYLQSRAIAAIGSWKGILGVSLLFAGYHIPHNIFINGQSGLALIMQTGIQFILGSVLGVLYYKNKSIFAPVLLHALINWSQFLHTVKS